MDDFDKLTQREIERVAALEPTRRTRRDRVLLSLSKGYWVGALDLALDAGGLGYRSRISELRRCGVSVERRRSPLCPKGESWHEYRLPPVGD